MLFMSVADWIQVAVMGAQTGLQVAMVVKITELMRNMFEISWLIEQARKFCIEFDQILIRYSDQIYGYFTEIVGGTLITPEIVAGLRSRVYIIIGIFIFFKIMMVAMRYMLNPEQFTDDKAGAQTLVKRIIIGSLIIIMIPTIFDIATRLQSAIIRDRVIEKIILPDDVYDEIMRTNNPGKDLGMLVFNGFFDWNTSVQQNLDSKTYNSYNKVKVYNDLTLFNKDYINSKVNDVYSINYIPIISTLAVGYLLVMLIKYAMEVAFRSFKLMFLQLLSPFVIVNYMLDTSKEEMLKKWTNATVSTYIMIFIRVMTLWLATLLCYYLNNGVNGESLLNTQDSLLKTLIVLALFAFLKDLPKVISDIFGYNLQENETIGGIVNQGVGILKGFAMGKVAMGATSHLRTLSNIGTGLGAAGGLAGGIAGGISEKGKGKFNMGVFNKGYSSMNAGLGAITQMNSSALTGVMGQTVLSPIAQTASASSHMKTMDDRDMVHGHDDGEKKHKTNKNDVNVANSISNNQNFSQYKNGDNFDLRPSTHLDSQGNPAPNPIVMTMAENVFNNLPEGSVSKNRETAINTISQHINQELQQRNITNDCSTRQMAEVMTKVTDELKVDVSSVTAPSQPTEKVSIESSTPTVEYVNPESIVPNIDTVTPEIVTPDIKQPEATNPIIEQPSIETLIPNDTGSSSDSGLFSSPTGFRGRIPARSKDADSEYESFLSDRKGGNKE